MTSSACKKSGPEPSQGLRETRASLRTPDIRFVIPKMRLMRAYNYANTHAMSERVRGTYVEEEDEEDDDRSRSKSGAGKAA